MSGGNQRLKLKVIQMKSLCCDWLGSADTVRLLVRVAAAVPAVSDLHHRALSAPTALTPRTAHAPPTETRPETAAENPPNGLLPLHLSVSVSPPLCLRLSGSMPPPVYFCLHLSVSMSMCLLLSPPISCLCPFPSPSLPSIFTSTSLHC